MGKKNFEKINKFDKLLVKLVKGKKKRGHNYQYRE